MTQARSTTGMEWKLGPTLLASALTALLLMNASAPEAAQAPQQPPIAKQETPGSTVKVGTTLTPTVKKRAVTKEADKSATKATTALLQQIDALESQQSAFSPHLGESIQQLAKHYFDQQDFAQAAENYNRALYIERINFGLYSAQQKPILIGLVASLEAQNKWPEAFAKQQYAHWLYNRREPNSPLDSVSELQALADWHIKAYLKTDKVNHLHLVEAQKLYLQYVKTYDKNDGANDKRLIPVFQGLLNATYYLANSYHETLDASTGIRFGDNKQALERQSQINQYYLRSYQEGRRAIQRIQEIYQNLDTMDPQTEIKLQLYKADWDQLFGKSHSAQRGYVRAFHQAEANEQDANALFAQPKMLPTIEQQVHQPEIKITGYGLAEFDVSHNGLAKNINIVETMPDKSKAISRMTKKFLRNARFRPAFNEGRPITAENVRQKYSFP